MVGHSVAHLVAKWAGHLVALTADMRVASMVGMLAAMMALQKALQWADYWAAPSAGRME